MAFNLLYKERNTSSFMSISFVSILFFNFMNDEVQYFFRSSKFRSLFFSVESSLKEKNSRQFIHLFSSSFINCLILSNISVLIIDLKLTQDI